jgi:leucine dehydrogenase
MRRRALASHGAGSIGFQYLHDPSPLLFPRYGRGVDRDLSGVFMFDQPDFDYHEAVNFICDDDSDLRAIVAIHNTRRGPAIGGCRVWHYCDEHQALRDALRLSRGMTHKAAIAGVPFGGGKAVVLVDQTHPKTPAMMRALGRAIDKMGGNYITGEDVGTTCEDMSEIRTATPYVMGLPVEQGGSGDPSRSTATGCFEGIRASLLYVLKKSDLQRVRVAVQGLGNVGYHLCRQLTGAAAQLIVTDVDPHRARRCAQEFGAAVVSPDQIYDVDAEVFAPCALGGVLNVDTISRLRVRIVAGGANNQLENTECGTALRDRDILYAPDYVINAGGMIQLAAERTGATPTDVERRVRSIYETLLQVYRLAEDWKISTSTAADALAAQRIAGSSQ